MYSKTAPHRLPTHRHFGGHRNFYDDPFLSLNWNLSQMSFVDDGMKQRVKTPNVNLF